MTLSYTELHNGPVVYQSGRQFAANSCINICFSAARISIAPRGNGGVTAINWRVTVTWNNRCTVKTEQQHRRQKRNPL